MRALRYCFIVTLSLVAVTAHAQTAPCVNGLAQPEGSPTAYPCDGVDLMARLPLAEMSNAFRGNDIWGWTDATTGSEYAIVALQRSTVFVDVTDAEQPVYLGRLPTHTQFSVWRDVKVYADHAYIVSEALGHGMQVFDLTQLRDIPTPPIPLTATAHYDRIGDSHNLAINEATGFAYIVGAGTDAEQCNEGLHMVDLAEPAAPAFAGCFAEAGYTHDAQCIVYDGPDADYTGQEVCFAFNEDRVVIVDVTDKQNPAMIEEVIYPDVDYTHQGWLTEDHRFLIGSDEGDERTFGINTRTLVFDVRDLDEPAFYDEFLHDTPAVDHNLYVNGDYVFQTNDTAGLRILDASSLLNDGATPGLEPVAFFDTHPETDAPVFEGAWSNYPYFESGNIIVNDRTRGLFVLRPRLGGTLAAEDGPSGTLALSAAYPNPFTRTTRFTLRAERAQAVRAEAYDVLGRRVAVLFDGAAMADEVLTLRLEGAGLPAGTYLVRIAGEDFAETRRVTLAR